MVYMAKERINPKLSYYVYGQMKPQDTLLQSITKGELLADHTKRQHIEYI